MHTAQILIGPRTEVNCLPGMITEVWTLSVPRIDSEKLKWDFIDHFGLLFKEFKIERNLGVVVKLPFIR